MGSIMAPCSSAGCGRDTRGPGSCSPSGQAVFHAAEAGLPEIRFEPLALVAVRIGEELVSMPPFS